MVINQRICQEKNKWSASVWGYYLFLRTFQWHTQTVESDDTTLSDNISDTLIASDNENDTSTSVSEEVEITDNEHGNIFAHRVPCNDDIIVISRDCESDNSVSILKKKKWKDNAFTLILCSSNV